MPYNRYLLLRYNAHINVEWCNRSKAIKYLFKYLNKGPDRATTMIQQNGTSSHQTGHAKNIELDEIRQFLDCRYLSPCEAAWRIFSFHIHQTTPSVMRLTFHLPDQHMITLRDSENLSGLLRRQGIRDTMFTEWFTLNTIDVEAR